MKTIEARIKITLRALFLKSEFRNNKLKESRVSRGKYKCECCGEFFSSKNINIHHIKEINEANDWNEYMELLFVDTESLMALCKSCHSDIHKELLNRRKETSKNKNN